MSQSPLGESFAVLSQFFVGDRTVADTLEHVAEFATDAIAPADFAGMTLLVEGRKRTAVFTDPASPEIDQAQYDTGEGPCLEAFETGRVIRVDSVLDDCPYPAFCQAAAEHGIRSTLSLPLAASNSRIGALNLYSGVERGFSTEDQRLAGDFAAQASIVLANAQAYWDAHGLSMRLQEAVEFRAVIEQAKGILMAGQRCTADEAFQVLVAASQRENTKLRDIAQRIVDRAVNGSPGQGEGT